MIIDAERLSQIQAVMYMEDDGVSFFVEGKASDKDIGWYVTNSNKIFEHGAIRNGDYVYFEQTDTFLEKTKDKELVAKVDDSEGQEHRIISKWDELAKELGISELVVISTKVPKVIARRFEYFSERKGTKSEELRKLVIQYVKESMVGDIDRLMFKDNI